MQDASELVDKYRQRVRVTRTLSNAFRTIGSQSTDAGSQKPDGLFALFGRKALQPVENNRLCGA